MEGIRQPNPWTTKPAFRCLSALNCTEPSNEDGLSAPFQGSHWFREWSWPPAEGEHVPEGPQLGPQLGYSIFRPHEGDASWAPLLPPQPEAIQSLLSLPGQWHSNENPSVVPRQAFWLHDFVIIHFSQSDFIVIYSLVASIRGSGVALVTAHKGKGSASWTMRGQIPAGCVWWRVLLLQVEFWGPGTEARLWKHLLSLCKLILVCHLLAWECSGPRSRGGRLLCWCRRKWVGLAGVSHCRGACGGCPLQATGLCCSNTKLLGS